MNCSYLIVCDSSVGKEPACNAGDPGLIPGLGRFAGEGIGYPLQYSWASLVAQLVRIHLQCGRPGFYPWVGKIPWRRERLPTPVFWPGEFHGLYSPWSHKESDTTEWLFYFHGSFLPGLLRNLHTVLHSGCLHSLVYIPTNKVGLSLCSFSNLIFLIT